MGSYDSKRDDYNALQKGREKGWDIGIVGLVLWVISMVMTVIFGNLWLVAVGISTAIMLHGTYWVEKAWHDYTGISGR